MNSNQTLTDIFHKNKLSKMILNDSIKIAVYEYDKLFKEKSYSTSQLLTKDIFNNFSAFQNVIMDLEKTIIFLRINFNDILEIYPNLEDKKSYYVYHFENYFIRINTISDLVGKLGNLICKTGIDNEKCNGYNFKEAVKKENQDVSDLVKKILEFTKELKIIRHQKIHTGKTEIENIKDIVLWSDLAKYTKDEYDSLLDELTESRLDIEIDRIESEIKELLKLTNKYFDYLSIEYDKL